VRVRPRGQIERALGVQTRISSAGVGIPGQTQRLGEVGVGLGRGFELTTMIESKRNAIGACVEGVRNSGLIRLQMRGALEASVP